MTEKITYESSGKRSTLNFNRFPLDTKEDPKKIFNFPFLSDSVTISSIKNHGHVMFIVRGPPYTKKTKLSDMLKETYPGSPYCSMVKVLENFNDKDDSSRLDHATIQQTFNACMKSVEKACLSKKSAIIVQNSHMRKMEMKNWLDLAAKYDYIVLMAATMYKFDITPEALLRPGGLDYEYLNKRFREWEDVPPLFTAWFISPDDSEYIRSITFEKLKTMLEMHEFLLWLGTEDITSYFHPRANLCCLAGYSADSDTMKKYYFSNEVQNVYGTCFPIFILGYLITKSDIIGVAQLNKNVKSLVMDNTVKSNGNITSKTPSSLLHYGKTTQFDPKGKLPPRSLGKKRAIGEKVLVKMCRPIHIAQKGCNIFSLDKVIEQFEKGLQLMSDSDGVLKEMYLESELYKLNDDLWFVNVSEKFHFSTIFTGFYV